MKQKQSSNHLSVCVYQCVSFCQNMCVFQSVCECVRQTGVMISGASFFPDLLVQGLKKGKIHSLKESLKV